MIGAIIGNCNRNPDSRPFAPDDFMEIIKEPKDAAKQSDDEQAELAKIIHAALQ